MAKGGKADMGWYVRIGRDIMNLEGIENEGKGR